MKTDLTIKRAMTINIGNYSNIQPAVELTIKDVELKDLDKAYQATTNIVENLQSLEIATAYGQVSQTSSLDTFSQGIIKNLEEIGGVLEENLNILIKIGK